MPLTVPNLAEALFVAWQNPGTRRFHAVGRLAYLPVDSGGLYEFAYIRGTCAVDEAGFRPFLAFPDLHRVYRSNALFPFFANRLMPRSRPEYAEFLSWLDLDPETATPIQILGRMRGPPRHRRGGAVPAAGIRRGIGRVSHALSRARIAPHAICIAGAGPAA